MAFLSGGNLSPQKHSGKHRILSMDSTSFGSANTGFQVGSNHGVINFSPARPETPQQWTDNDLLRSLAFPQMLDRRDNIEPRHTNTCQWILELDEYQSWRNQAPGLLWIKGKPGAGKSTVMVFLHDRVQGLQDGNQGIRLDFFFSARGTKLQRTPLGMLRSLLNQIFDRDTCIRPQVRDIYEQRCRQFGYGERKWEWPQVMLEELLARTILASANQQPVTVFVDALDEAGAEFAEQIAAYFHRLVHRADERKLALRVCISCRHFPAMPPAPAITINVEDHNQEDIAKYVKDMLIDTEVGNDSIQAELVKELTQHANGVFQWAHLILPLIRRRILEGESFDDVRSFLREVPAGLEDVYVSILSDLIEARNREQSFLLFQWVCLAERPLTVTELRYALAANNAPTKASRSSWEKTHGFIESDERMKRKVRALAGGLATVVLSTDHKETVQVIHQSVNDFLRRKGLALLYNSIDAGTSIVDEYNIVLRCQASLYRSCLNYLTTGQVSIKPFDLARSKDKFLADLPFLHYAAINLFIHAEKAAYSRTEMLENEMDILRQTIGFWTLIYRVLDRPNPACPDTGTTVLHMAAAANLIDLIETVVAGSEDIHRRDGSGNTALHFAARAGHTILGKMLAEKGADQESENKFGATPLADAASHGRMEFVIWLLQEGVKVDRGGETALQAASLRGNSSVVEILLGAGANANAQSGQYGNALQAAASSGNAETVKMLLDAHADVNSQGGEYGNALQAATWRGHSEIVKMLLDAHADVNAQGGQFGNALQAAAWCGNAETVKMLLDAHADVNAQGGQFGNALKAAAWRGHSEIVKMLLDAHADVNAQGGEYGNALQAAAWCGNAETVKMLLDAHADVNAQGGQYGNALQAAASSGNAETVKMLLDAHADVNAQGGQFGNALQAAAWRGHSEIVKMLLDAHADVNAQGGKDGNALQAAAWCGNAETVKMLLDAHADVNAQGGEYGNALQAAAWCGNAETVKMLLDAHADVNAQGGQYGNALQAAAWCGNAETVKMLLDAHADVNAQGGEYGNALQAAAWRGDAETVKMLLDAHADVNAQGGEYGNALQAAAWRGNAETVKMLLDAHADVNAQGGQYGNALQAAASSGNAETVKMLLDAHADVNSQGGEYGNALQAATWRGHSEIVKMLLDAHADVNAQGGQFGNALQAATWRGDAKTVKILLDVNADVNSQGGRYGNALQAAAYSGNAETVKMLLDAHADVNAQGGEYGNALQAAAFRSNAETVKILLHAHADVNAQGGRYGSALLAAVANGHAETVQILLDAGADALRPDELGQFPLHFVASGNMLQIFSRFPQFLLAINNRSKLLQTPLHLAVCHGHINFAITLLRFGADPTLSDGYGRNIIDWVSGHEPLMQAIGCRWPQLALTSYIIQESTTYQSLIQLSDMLSYLSPIHQWCILQQIGRYFLFLNSSTNASALFQIQLPTRFFLNSDACEAICEFCHRFITGTRFVCKVCADTDICSSCVQKYPVHGRIYPNQVHDVFQVPNRPNNVCQLTEPAPERLTLFLSNSFHQSETDTLHDVVVDEIRTSNLARIIFAILSGVLAFAFGVWYL